MFSKITEFALIKIFSQGGHCLVFCVAFGQCKYKFGTFHNHSGFCFLFLRPSLSIHERLEYLSRAIMSAKSCNLVTSASMEGEFLHELEEKLEVNVCNLTTRYLKLSR